MSTQARRMGSAGAWNLTTALLLAWQLALGAPALRPAWAGPEGAKVVRGQVRIDSLGNDTVIHASDRSIIDYRGFDVGARETVQFVQPSESARVLNRIESARPTQIDGAIFANGRVYFVNPSGVYFGAGARVDVAEITAAAGHISNEDFLAGIDHFTGLTGAVQNEGSIHADVVRLVGEHVANRGSISADGGLIVLVAGGDVLLGEPGSRLYVKIGGAAPADPSRPGVEQSGSLAAEGGSVLLAGGDLLGLAISHSGATRAEEIRIAGGEHGVVEVSGTLDASDRTPGGRGGHIEVTGEQVALRGALLDASGDSGGGSVLVGGDFQGRGDVRTAVASFIDPQSRIRADALSRGDGGSVVVWAEDGTAFYGAISARGGAAGGDGGMVEVSGKERLFFHGAVDTLAPAGLTGSLLLDPTDITVMNGTGNGGGDSSTTSFTGTPSGITGSVLFADTGPTTIFQSELQGLSASTNVLLQATNNITIQDLSSSTPALNNLLALPATGSVTFQAGNAFSMDPSDTIRTQGASLSISGASVALGSLSTRGSANTLSAPITVNSSGASDLTIRTINAGAGAVSLTSGGALLSSASLVTAGTLSLNAGTTIGTLASPLRAQLSGVLNASAPSGIVVTTQTTPMRIGAINAGAGNVSLTAATGAANSTIVDDGNPLTRIVANNLTLTANQNNASIGSAAAPIQTTLAGALNISATGGTIGNVAVSESNGLSLGSIVAVGKALTLKAEAGSITDDGVVSTTVAARAASFTANPGESIGTPATPLVLGRFFDNTLVTTVTAVAPNGPGVFISDLSAMNVGQIDAGSGPVVLSAGFGAINDDGLTSTTITASSLSLSATGAKGNIGYLEAPLLTHNVASLTAASSGAVVVHNLTGGDLSLDGVSSTGIASTSTGYPMPPVEGVVSIRNDAGKLLVNSPITVSATTDPFEPLEKGSIFLDTPYQIEIGLPSLIAGRNLYLNQNISADQIVDPLLATIVVYPGTSGDPAADARNLTLTALNGSVIMGQGQTLSVPGTLQINATEGTPGYSYPLDVHPPPPYDPFYFPTFGTATIADVNALEIEINAEQAFVYLREPRQLYAQNGTLVTDFGGDVVANEIRLNLDEEMKTIGTGEHPIFATAKGLIVAGAPDGTRFGRPLIGDIEPASLQGLAGAAAGQILDLRGTASSTEGTPDAVPPVPYAFRRDDGQLAQLNAEAAAASNLWGSDLVAFLRCSRAPGDDADRVPVACLGYDQTRQSRAPFTTPLAVGARSDYRSLLARRDSVRSSLGAAFDAYKQSAGGEPTGAGFRRFLEENAWYGGALDSVRELGDLFHSLDSLLGADRAAGGSFQPWREGLLRDFTPDGMSPALLYEATGASVGAVQSASR